MKSSSQGIPCVDASDRPRRLGWAQRLAKAALTAICVATLSPLHAAPITGLDLLTGQIVFFDSPNPLVQTPGPTVTPTRLFAMDYNLAATKLYALDDDTRKLGELNLATGAFTEIAMVTGADPGLGFTGLSVDPASGLWYLSTTNISSSSLFTLHMSTGAASLVGSQSMAPALIDIAIDAAGRMFGLDIVTDSLYRIDKLTGAVTLLGPAGVDVNYAQGMDFDDATGTLHAVPATIYVMKSFGTFNTTRGVFTQLAPVAQELELAVAVPFKGRDHGVPEPSVLGLAATGLAAGVVARRGPQASRQA